MKSFCVVVERLKQTNDDEISSTNLIEIEGFPLQYTYFIFLILIQGNLSNLPLMASSNMVIQCLQQILTSTLQRRSSVIPFHYGAILPLSTFFGSILSVTRQDESTMALETHLNEGSKLFYSVMESSPSLTGGSTNFTSQFYNWFFKASFPIQISARLIWRGVSLRSQLASWGIISERDLTLKFVGRLGAARMFSALSRFDVKKLTLCSMSSSVQSKVLFQMSIIYQFMKGDIAHFDYFNSY